MRHVKGKPQEGGVIQLILCIVRVRLPGDGSAPNAAGYLLEETNGAAAAAAAAHQGDLAHPREHTHTHTHTHNTGSSNTWPVRATSDVFESSSETASPLQRMKDGRGISEQPAGGYLSGPPGNI
jgi:hypothetical protein